ncbi:Na/Pi cotransporter family protein [Thiomicrorhabdus sp. 6S2-11]|uniref:Na/Pi cotransporter family protein n=1 Tax=Thiomicrorhabdus marina TaxID=2818442 RepID=A0ABS3Q6P2_9GAMM|nr:Na/Pi symporter [Thiomicrorhabdus marina]MBO1927937.1 Na/Pi cotransporter family protein [Thiomicrorhabdus marina]
MTENVLETPKEQELNSAANWRQWLTIALLVYLLLIAVGMIGSGFKEAAGGQAKELFEFASNPITALVIGIIATALIQSSSTVTSIIVGLVAGGMPVEVAIPMVMGANIGTTITNTIVSMGFVKKGEDFKRAFQAATVHDFFNVLSVVIFLPLEIMFGILEKIGAFFANMMLGGQSLSVKEFNFLKPIVKPPVKFLQNTFDSWGFSDVLSGSVLILLGITLIFVVITAIGKILKLVMVGRAKRILHSAVGRGPVSGIASGTGITVLVQSSSTTTSLIVPLAGSGVFSLRQVYPFTLGANIGTTITALLAATAVSGDNAIFALQIALVHFFYNLIGVIVIYGVPFLREIPLNLAVTLASLAERNKLYVAAYMLLLFIIIPLILIGFSEWVF